MKISYDQIKPIAEVAAVGNIAATLMTWLPPIAALLSIVWYVANLYILYKKNKKAGS